MKQTKSAFSAPTVPSEVWACCPRGHGRMGCVEKTYIEGGFIFKLRCTECTGYADVKWGSITP